MQIDEVIFALITGLTSAVVYSLIQGIYLYFRWSRTRRFFTWKIRESMTLVTYHVMNILDIDAIYDTEYEQDHLISDEELVLDVEDKKITLEEYRKLNHIMVKTKEDIERFRKEALTIPTFTSSDFHAIDKFLHEIANFVSFYSWIEEKDTIEEIEKIFKPKLIRVLSSSKENPFPNSILDDIQNWYRNKRHSIKLELTKKKNNPETFEDKIPF